MVAIHLITHNFQSPAPCYNALEPTPIDLPHLARCEMRTVIRKFSLPHVICNNTKNLSEKHYAIIVITALIVIVALANGSRDETVARRHRVALDLSFHSQTIQQPRPVEYALLQ
jgi:hypothetical protein